MNGSLSVETLRKLSRDSTALHKQLQEISSLFDECSDNAVDFLTVSGRMSKVFVLYKELTAELDRLQNETSTARPE